MGACLGLQSYEIELNYTEFTWLNGFPARPPRPRLPQVFITRPNDQPMGRKGEMQAQVEAHDPIPDAWKTLKIDVPGFCVFFVLCASHII